MPSAEGKEATGASHAEWKRCESSAMADLAGSAEREKETSRLEVQRERRRRRPSSVNTKILVSFWCLGFFDFVTGD